jgi:tetratricopeptide (TPR) repeat protein
MNMIKSMDLPGIAMLEGDYAVMPQMYFKYVEKRGSFCPVTTTFLSVPWSVKNLKNECPGVRMTVGGNAPISDKIRNIVESNYTDNAVYASVFRKDFEEYYPQGNAALVPYGAVLKLTLDKAAALKEASKKLRELTYRGLLEDRSYMNITTRLGLSNYSSLYLETGNAYAALNNNALAMNYLQKALALSNDRTRAICLTHLGVLESKTGDNKQALVYYKEAVSLDKNMVEAYSNMAGIYNTDKEYDLALSACADAIKSNPAFSEAYNNMAIAYFNKGMKDKAVEMMEKAVSLSPGNEMAKRNLQILKGEIK